MPRNPSTPGPKPTVTPAKKRAIIESVERGLSLADALLVHGISRAAFRRARDDDEEFGHGIKSAAAKGKDHHLRRIHDGVPNWQSSAWLLERKYGAEYGQKVRLDLGGTVQVVEEVIGDAAQEAHHTNGKAPSGAGRLPSE